MSSSGIGDSHSIRQQHEVKVNSETKQKVAQLKKSTLELIGNAINLARETRQKKDLKDLQGRINEMSEGELNDVSNKIEKIVGKEIFTVVKIVSSHDDDDVSTQSTRSLTDILRDQDDGDYQKPLTLEQIMAEPEEGEEGAKFSILQALEGAVASAKLETAKRLQDLQEEVVEMNLTEVEDDEDLNNFQSINVEQNKGKLEKNSAEQEKVNEKLNKLNQLKFDDSFRNQPLEELFKAALAIYTSIKDEDDKTPIQEKVLRDAKQVLNAQYSDIDTRKEIEAILIKLQQPKAIPKPLNEQFQSQAETKQQQEAAKQPQPKNILSKPEPEIKEQQAQQSASTKREPATSSINPDFNPDNLYDYSDENQSGSATASSAPPTGTAATTGKPLAQKPVQQQQQPQTEQSRVETKRQAASAQEAEFKPAATGQQVKQVQSEEYTTTTTSRSRGSPVQQQQQDQGELKRKVEGDVKEAVAGTPSGKAAQVLGQSQSTTVQRDKPVALKEFEKKRIEDSFLKILQTLSPEKQDFVQFVREKCNFEVACTVAILIKDLAFTKEQLEQAKKSGTIQLPTPSKCTISHGKNTMIMRFDKGTNLDFNEKDRLKFSNNKTFVKYGDLPEFTLQYIRTKDLNTYFGLKLVPKDKTFTSSEYLSTLANAKITWEK